MSPTEQVASTTEEPSSPTDAALSSTEDESSANGSGGASSIVGEPGSEPEPEHQPVQVDGDQTDDAASRIGGRLAALRGQRGLRVSDLARRISVSPSLISQIERGHSRPSVTTLFALAQQLEVPVDAFFETAPAQGGLPDATVAAPLRPHEVAGVIPPEGRADQHGYVVHRGRRQTVDICGGVRWERLTPSSLNGVDFVELVYQPGAESDPQLYRHPGTELVLVIEGCLDITVSFDVNHLEAGDSIAFPSSLPHRYVNPTDRITRAVSVMFRDDVLVRPGG